MSLRNHKSSNLRTIEKLYCTHKFWASIIELRIELNESYKKMIVVRGRT